MQRTIQIIRNIFMDGVNNIGLQKQKKKESEKQKQRPDK